MEVCERRIIYPSRTDTYRLFPISDAHAGTKHCAEELIKRKVNEIKDDPNALWFGGGDLGEFISMNDSRFDIGIISDWVKPDDIVESQRRWIVHLLEPIKDKCLGLLEGNHEDSCRIHFHGDVHQHICEDLGVPNLGYSAFIKLVFSRIDEKSNSKLILCHVQHGSGSCITIGAKLNKLQRQMLSFDADIYAMGHMHEILTITTPYLTLDKQNMIKQKVKVGAVTGSWVRAYTQNVRASYAEKRSYPPTSLGAPIFTIRPDKDEITVSG